MCVLPKPNVILTHESDLDGLVSGLLLQRLARKLFAEEIRLEAWHTHAWQNRPLDEPAAWVADFSFDARMDRPNWVVFDHHPASAQPVHARLIHDPGKSAGRLCYDLCCANGLQSDALDRLVQLNDVADLFLHEHADFELASDYASLVKAYHFWNLHEVIGGELERLLDHPLLEVMATRRRVENPLGLECSRRSLQPLTPEIAYVPVVVGNPNQIVHELLYNGAGHFSTLMTLARRGNGLVVASLRSRNGEALAVAGKLQGGGHPDAAGATLPRNIRSIPDALDYLRRVLAPPTANPPCITGMAGLLETFDNGLKAG